MGQQVMLGRIYDYTGSGTGPVSYKQLQIIVLQAECSKSLFSITASMLSLRKAWFYLLFVSFIARGINSLDKKRERHKLGWILKG